MTDEEIEARINMYAGDVDRAVEDLLVRDRKGRALLVPQQPFSETLPFRAFLALKHRLSVRRLPPQEVLRPQQQLFAAGAELRAVHGWADIPLAELKRFLLEAAQAVRAAVHAAIVDCSPVEVALIAPGCGRSSGAAEEPPGVGRQPGRPLGREGVGPQR